MALMGLALSSCSKYDYEEVKGDLTQTRIYTLKNGLKVYLSVNKEEPRIQTYIAVRTGSKNDPAETTGLAHYLEHLMFKGTSQFGTTDAAKEAPLLDEIEQRYEKYRKMTDPEERRQAYHERLYERRCDLLCGEYPFERDRQLGQDSGRPLYEHDHPWLPYGAGGGVRGV